MSKYNNDSNATANDKYDNYFDQLTSGVEANKEVESTTVEEIKLPKSPQQSTNKDVEDTSPTASKERVHRVVTVKFTDKEKAALTHYCTDNNTDFQKLGRQLFLSLLDNKDK